MRWLNRMIDAAVERRGGYTYIADAIRSAFGTLSGRPAWRYPQFIEEGYIGNPVVRAAIDEIADALNELEFGLAKDGKSIEREEWNEQQKALMRLLARPNANQARSVFFKKLVAQCYCTTTAAYIRAINTGTQVVGRLLRTRHGAELYLLSPSKVEAKAEDMRVTEYVFLGKKVDLKLKPEEVLALRPFPHPDEDFESASPLESISTVIDGLNDALKFQRATLKNSGVPAVLLLLKGLFKLPKPEQEKVRADYKHNYEGAVNAGKTFITDGDQVDHRVLSMSPRELDWSKSTGQMARHICAVIGTPTILLGDPERGTYSNYSEARKAFYQETVLPFAGFLVGELNHWLAPQYEDDLEIVVLYDHIDCLSEDETRRVERTAKKTWRSVNEQREEDGLDPVTDNEDANVPIALLRPAFDPFAAEPGAPEDEPSEEGAEAREGRSITIPFRAASTRPRQSAARR